MFNKNVGILAYNFVCIPESFNTNISHQLFDYKITFVNSQRKNTNSKGDFKLKTWFENIYYYLSFKDILAVNILN